MSEVRLEELLAPGVAADDVPELAPLLGARPLLACLASDDGNQPIPTLVRQELAGTTMSEVAIAEG
ncbi:MAG: hypothetical protein J0L85_09380, partial [Zoogloea sp.]|nr:hypothetical protein [Zoogloea sp.]